MDKVFDVAVIGGGINGCGCAADAALRGLSVVLIEKDDLASKTSSSSTKLIHGGLRYLEHYEFGLVKKALDERQTLLSLAPHLVHPQSFILPYEHHMRPAWFLRLGLFFYDHLSRKSKLPKCKSLHRSNKSSYFEPLLKLFKRGFLFYDATTDDARLTLCNAIQAQRHGAHILTHSEVIETQILGSLWKIVIKSKQGKTFFLYAKSLINATGPWVTATANRINIPTRKEITLVQGSHIVVPKMYEGKHAYFLQHADKRVIFVIPYHGLTMIGTTDVNFSGPLDKVSISKEEIHYLTDIVNSYFSNKISSTDIIYSWSGIRPLIANEGKDIKSLSRDYSYEYQANPAPNITIFGGKITTYRQLAVEIIDQLAPVFPNLPPSKTKQTPLPGAILGTMSFSEYLIYAKEKYSWLDDEILNRYLFSYGTSTEILLSECTSIEHMGTLFGSSLYQVEVDYLVSQEWARDSDDVLYRRTKLGLQMDSVNKQELVDYLRTVVKD